MDLHFWRVPQWSSETETHDKLVELCADLFHSPEFDDLTHGVPINLYAKLFPRKESDVWRKATVSIPLASVGQRVVALYGNEGPKSLPHSIRVQPHVGATQPALWERLRTTTYVPPAEKRGEGETEYAIPIHRIAYGRLLSLDAHFARWSEEWRRSQDRLAYALFDDPLFDRVRIETVGRPAIVLTVRDVRSAIIDVSDHRALVLLLLAGPAPFLQSTQAGEEDGIAPGQLNFGQGGPPQHLLARHADLGAEHADVASYISTELLFEIDRKDWPRFEASAAELGLPLPFKRDINIEHAALYSENTLYALNRHIQNIAHAAIAVQLDALCRSGALVPKQIIALAGETSLALRAKKPAEQLVVALAQMGTRMLPRMLLYEGDTISLNSARWQDEWQRAIGFDRPIRIDDDVSISTCRAFVTPTGIRIDGPFVGISNRIMRTYGHSEHFLRVAFVDEDLSPFSPNGEIDIEDFIAKRFQPFLRDGIDIGGHHFSLLAFSMSSIREHGAFFVAPFFDTQRQKWINADTIRDEIGDLSSLSRLPARYSARLSQALSGTECAIELDASWVTDQPDLLSPTGEMYTDGTGVMSTAVAKLIHDALPFLHLHRWHDRRPLSAVQIRLGGCKGMIQLDPALEGHQVLLRPSMRKFIANETILEICQSFREPMAYNLNRPLVQILEALAVDVDRFLQLQGEAMSAIEKAREQAKAAAVFTSSYNFGEAYGLSRLFRHFHATLRRPTAHRQDPFLTRIVDIAIHIARREVKHRSRIPVPGSWTLVGVADVHGVLKEDEIYACVLEPHTGFKIYLEGPIAVSRSPTEHPGDIQMVTAVGRMPEQHQAMYEPLVNVVIFPSKGDRPMPSQLAGGDLDGDIFNLLVERSLHPAFTCQPAAESTLELQPLTLEEDCKGEDIADWFVNFMQHDNLGIVSSLRLMWADFLEEGPLHGHCIGLAELASAAVDYRKTGARVPPDLLGKAPDKRPDFMQPEGAPLGLHAYYPSKKALGRLYRAIELPETPDIDDESTLKSSETLFEEIEEACTAVSFVANDSSTLALSNAPALLSGYASALRRLCSAQTPALTEAEAVVGRAVAPLPAKDPRRRAASAREVEAGTAALTTWVRREMKDAHAAMGVWRFARKEGERWGARSLAWLAAVVVLDKVAELQLVEKDARAGAGGR